MNTQVRRRTLTLGEGKAVSKQPVAAVHVDVSRERAVQRLCSAFGKDLEGRRIAFMCVVFNTVYLWSYYSNVLIVTFGARYEAQSSTSHLLSAMREQSMRRIWIGRLIKYGVRRIRISSTPLMIIEQHGGGYFIRQNCLCSRLLWRLWMSDVAIGKMRWSYIRNQMPDEILVFRQFDSGMLSPNFSLRVS